ncbi:MAG: hypothetical protein FJX72_03925 [Armatimonadetes bacterium]|nr:hypothetical protein [Armatimonadota bacterium]
MTTAVRTLRFLAALGAICALCLRPALADAPALSFSDYSNVSQGNFVVGWEFDVLSPITVSSLGMCDYVGLDPNGHDVGIYDSSMALVASTKVMPGDPLSGYFRFGALTTPVTLAAGNGYRIAGVSLNRYYAYDFSTPPTGWTVDPRLRYVDDRYASGSTLQYPANQYPDIQYGLFGPNMLIRDSDPVPEPAMLQLPVLLGLSGLAWWRRRRA